MSSRAFVRKNYYYLMALSLGLYIDAWILPERFIPVLVVPVLVLLGLAGFGYHDVRYLRCKSEK